MGLKGSFLFRGRGGQLFSRFSVYFYDTLGGEEKEKGLLLILLFCEIQNS